MRPENELSNHHKINYVCINFHCGQNEMEFPLGGGLR